MIIQSTRIYYEEEFAKKRTLNYNGLSTMILNELKSKAANDTILESVLNGDAYVNNRDMTRYALFSLLDVIIKSIPSTKETTSTLDLWRLEKTNPCGQLNMFFLKAKIYLNLGLI